MGGIGRVYNIPKVLKELGWEVDIYTPYPPRNYPKDEESFNTKNLNIIRTPSLDPFHILPSKILKSGSGKRDYLSFPDNKVLWLPFLLKKIKKTNVIVISCPPFSLMLLLFFVKNTPCVIDYRDLWVGSYLGEYLFKWEEALAKRIEKYCIQKASLIITVTDGIRKILISEYPEAKNKIHLIRNGFDKNYPFTTKKKKKEKLIFTYMGSFSDIFNPEIVFEGFEELFALNPELKERIAFKYIGPSMREGLVKRAREIGLSLISKGYLPYKRAFYELRNSDILILIGGGKEDSWLIPSKLYQYIAAGQPIIAITRNEEIKDLIGSSGVICEPTPLSIATSIVEVLKNLSKFKPTSNYLKYSWENLGKEYSELLMKIL
ncbi:MAG: glycosyltransferase [candidate division WOR-3 bacterium]